MTPLIELCDVHYAYPQSPRIAGRERPLALAGVTLSILPRARLTILGANGAGKSTLLWHLNGTLRPSTGTIRYAGKPFDYSRRGLTDLRQRVAFVLQEPDDQLFAGTIRQDVSFGPLNLGLSEAESSARVEEALRAMDLVDLAELPPHQLSHGQRKRAAIAGALAMRPELLVLDEPTAGLDPRGIDALKQQLEHLHDRGVTIVLTTHDMDFAHSWTDEVAVMQHGRVVAAGHPDAILGNAALMSRTDLRLPAALAIRAALLEIQNAPAAHNSDTQRGIAVS